MLVVKKLAAVRLQIKRGSLMWQDAAQKSIRWGMM